MAKLEWNEHAKAEMYYAPWPETLTEEEAAFNMAVYNRVVGVSANEPEPVVTKKAMGRPLKGTSRKYIVSITINKEDHDALKRFGKGGMSAGIERAAAMVRQYNLYDREDC